MRRAIALIYLLLLIVGVFAGVSAGLLHRFSKKTEAIGAETAEKSPAKQDKSITMALAFEMLTDYEKDHDAADEKYKGKMLEVTGLVGRFAFVVETLPPHPTIQLYLLCDGKFYVVCEFNSAADILPAISEPDRFFGFQEGDVVALVGRCTGREGHIYLKNCVLVRHTRKSK